jgi:hypothetical protein
MRLSWKQERMTMSNSTDVSKNHLINCSIALIAVFFVFHFIAQSGRSDIMHQPFGWDARCDCAAVEAYTQGLDPYYVKNLKDTSLSYPYPPVTLDVLKPVCADGLMANHYQLIYLILGIGIVFLMSLHYLARDNIYQTFLTCLFIFGAFAGFQWVFAWSG